MKRLVYSTYFAWRGFVFSSLLLLVLFSTALYAFEKSEKGEVLDVTIPQFNENGFISWELHAASLKPMEDEVFFARKPVLFLFSNKILETKAESDFGYFSLKSETAKGEGSLEIFGNGFFAHGIDWHWMKNVSGGENQILIDGKARVVFEQGLDNLFVEHSVDDESECANSNSIKNEDNDQLIPTTAYADNIEFLSIGKNAHRFLLNKNVKIVGNNLFLTCDNMEVLFTKDENSSKSPVGTISFIRADGNIVLKQAGRTSYARKMSLDTKAGTVLLSGNARVVDEEWGEASGPKIILEKGTRVAKVIGDEKNPSRVEIPALPDFGFSKEANEKRQ